MSNTGNAIRSSLAPWITVNNIVKAVDFYRRALGATEAYRMEDPDGNLQVVKLAIDDAEFWLSTSGEGSPEQAVGGGTVRMILTVTNPDAIFNQALQAGAIEVFPVGEEYGWRLGRLIDPFGLHWEIGRQLSE